MLLTARPAAQALRGSLRPPGDKSISHRSLILGALAEGETRIGGLLGSADVRATASAVRQLGARIEHSEDQTTVRGLGKQGLREPRSALDMGNSGTAMRLLAGVLAAQPFHSTLIGDASLSRRPMRRIIEPLQQMGASIRGTANQTAPLQITGDRLDGIDYASPVASAQVKSCVLLAGLFAEGRTRVREPEPSRDHTERMLAAFGAPLDAEGWLEGGAQLVGTRIGVPADPSSAAFPLAAALLVPGSEITLENVGLNPTRTGFLDAVRAMGAALDIEALQAGATEPTGTIRVRYSGRLKAIEIEAQQVPAMVDEIPVLMALAALADGTTRIRGATELRVKESDRLAVMGAALQALGVRVVLHEDGADIEGRSELAASAELDGAGDHRCVMSLAVLGLCSKSGYRVRGAEFISTSYPRFEDDLRALGAELSTGVAT